MKKPKSVHARELIRLAMLHQRRAIATLYCHRFEKRTGTKYTDEQRQLLHRAEQLADEAEQITRKVYAEIIGKLTVDEASQEAWP